jgi:toxin ParE1/3/4
VTVTWAARALSDLAGIYTYIAADNAEAAARAIDRLIATAGSLASFPHLGRPSRFAGRRELVVEQYVVTYRIHRDEIRILAVEHGARRR